MHRISGRDPATGQGIAITVDEGRIAAVEPGLPIEDAGRFYLSAGLVDLQVNGFAGIDLNDGSVTPETVAALAHKLLEHGVTTFLPTVITASERQITRTLEIIARAREGAPLLAHMIPCVHVEGPFISPDDGPRGAHPAGHVRPPDLAEFDRWQEACDGLVGMVTLSPHWPKAPDFIRAVSSQGVHVAIGHTGANHQQIAQAVDAGAVLSTHLGNGAMAVLPRHPNLIWSQLAEDRLTATFIADGHHLPAETFKAMLRAKGLERSVLVSDTAALGGLPPGTYDQPIGGRVVLTAESRLGIEGTPYLAGAARPLCDDVAAAMAMAGLSLAEALGLSSANPGRFVQGRGRLEAGADADVILFGWQEGAPSLAIRETWVGGEKVFER